MSEIQEIKEQTREKEYSHKFLSHRADTREDAREKLVKLGKQAGGETLEEVANHLKTLATDDEYRPSERAHTRDLLYQLAIESENEDIAHPAIVAHIHKLDESKNRAQLYDIAELHQSLVAEAVEGFRAATREKEYSHKFLSHRADTREDAREKLVEVGKKLIAQEPTEGRVDTLVGIAKHLKELSADSEYPPEERRDARTRLHELAIEEAGENVVPIYLSTIGEKSEADPTNIVNELVELVGAVDGEVPDTLGSYLLEACRSESVADDVRAGGLRTYASLLSEGRIESHENQSDQLSVLVILAKSPWDAPLPNPGFQDEKGEKFSGITAQDGSRYVVVAPPGEIEAIDLTITHDRFISESNIELTVDEHYEERQIPLDPERGTISLEGRVSGELCPNFQFKLYSDEFLQDLGYDGTVLTQTTNSKRESELVEREVPVGTYELAVELPTTLNCYQTESREIVVSADETAKSTPDIGFGYTLSGKTKDRLRELEDILADVQSSSAEANVYRRIAEEVLSTVEKLPDRGEWFLEFEVHPDEIADELLLLTEKLTQFIESLSQATDEEIPVYGTSLSDTLPPHEDIDSALALLRSYVFPEPLLNAVGFRQAPSHERLDLLYRHLTQTEGVGQIPTEQLDTEATVEILGRILCHEDTDNPSTDAYIAALQNYGRLSQIVYPVLKLARRDPADAKDALDTIFKVFTSESVDDDTLQDAMEILERIAEAAPEAIVNHTDTLEQLILDRHTTTPRTSILDDDVINICLRALIRSVTADDSRAAETVDSLQYPIKGLCRQVAEATSDGQWTDLREYVLQVFERLVRLDSSLVASNIHLLEDAASEDSPPEVRLAFARLISRIASQTNQADDHLATSTVDILVKNVHPDEDSDVLFYTLYAIDQILVSKAGDIDDETVGSIIQHLNSVLESHRNSDSSTLDSRIIENVFAVAATLAEIDPDTLLNTIEFHSWIQDPAYQRSATHVIANLAGERPREMSDFVMYFPRMLEQAIARTDEDNSIQVPYTTKTLANFAQVPDYHDRIEDLVEQFVLLLDQGDEQTQLYAILALRHLAEGEEMELSETAIERLRKLTKEAPGAVQAEARETLVSAGVLEPHSTTESGEKNVDTTAPQRSHIDRLSNLAFRLLQYLEYDVKEHGYYQTVDTLRVELDQREPRLREQFSDDHFEETWVELDALHRRIDQYSNQNISESNDYEEVRSSALVVSKRVQMYAMQGN